MVPKAKQEAKKQQASAADRARAFQQRGRVLAEKAAYVTVCAVLKDRPDLVREYSNELKEQGILDSHGNISSTYKPPVFAPVKEEESGQGEAGGSSSGDKPNADDEATLGDHRLHRNFSHWGAIPPKYLRWILSQNEPVSLSKFAFKAVTPTGGKVPPKNVLLPLLEGMADVAPDESCGNEPLVSELSAYIGRKNIENGRRFKELQLPANFDGKDAFYSSTTADGSNQVCLYDKFTRVTISVTVELKAGTFPKIELGYSYARAALMFTKPDGTAHRENIKSMFAVVSMNNNPQASLAIKLEEVPTGLKRSASAAHVGGAVTPTARRSGQVAAATAKAEVEEKPDEELDGGMALAVEPDEAGAARYDEAVATDEVEDGPPSDAAGGRVARKRRKEKGPGLQPPPKAKAKVREADVVPPAPAA